jgi:hypothetical protein
LQALVFLCQPNYYAAVIVHRWGWRIVTEYTGAAGPSSDHAAILWAEKPETPSRLLAVLLILLFLKAILLIPHLIIVSFYQFVAGIVAWIGFWIVLFTGTLPQGFHDFILGSLRWSWRTNAWFYGIVDEYPPFAADAEYPADADCYYSDYGSRLFAVLRLLGIVWILLLPHYFVLLALSLVALLGLFIAPWGVVFTGGYSQFAFNLLVGLSRWQHRVTAYSMGLTDDYPPFRMGH